ncbi:glycoside hydrolase family 5 protein [Streptacidiphilus sp. N1-12]|uniref:Glycoside hydrolase family 5 protein n=2 Tax=Streptacidiphilus alkalitolerans TaxID=3342712 RepID=A0ABV6VMT0_9ACTN
MPRELGTASTFRSTLAAGAAALLMLGACVASARYDPTGLFALLPWSALQVSPVHGLWSVSGVAVFLPVVAVVVFWGTLSSIRTARGGLGRRWLLLRVWGVSVLAVGIARLLQVLAELAGTAVHDGTAQHGGTRTGAMSLATALWTSGLTAERAVLLGWLPALGAALVHRRAGGPKLTGLGWGWSLVATALSAALLGSLVAPMLWEGSPAASLYGEHLSLRSLSIGPARYAVELVSAALVGAGLLSRSSRRFDCGRGTGLLLTGWLAALGGGAAAGVLQALLAAPRDYQGTDLLILPDAGLRIASGLSLGLAFGWAVVPTLLLTSGVLHAIAGERRRFRAVAASVLALALTSWVLSAAAPSSATARSAPVSPAARATAGAPLPALTVRDGRIEDVNGRQVLLRGVNVNQLNDYAAPTPGRATVRPLTAADFAGMAALGFNVVRLNVSWSLLEPQRGHWDPAYLKRIQDAVAQAAAQGMYTDIDMHQDAWSRYLAAPAGTSCPSGHDPLLGYDGAPQWATLTDGTSRCQGADRDLSPAVARAFSNFYHDTDGIQSELVRTWSLLARTFAGDPAVAGYGLLNEPGVGEDPPATSSVLLAAYYQRAVRAIRGQESGTANGFPHLVFIEPSVLWSGLGFDAAPPQGFSDDPYLVFAPHLYNESITVDQDHGLTLVSVDRGFALAQRQADAYGMPLWIGEWGWFGSGSTDDQRTAEFADAEDAHLTGGAFWVWKQACGDPQSDQKAATAGNLERTDCATGKDLPPDAAFAAVLSRPYPRFAPGELTRLTVDPQGRLTLEGTAPKAAAGAGNGCTLDVWFPGAARPVVAGSGVGGIDLRQVDGGWRITGCAGGSYRLTAGVA